MSGGYFDYKQYMLSELAEAVERAISNEKELMPITKAEFANGVMALKKAQVYLQRIDWLLSCDDGEESFHARLHDDLLELANSPTAL